MIAVVTIRPLPHYRRDAFVNGLKRLGYEIKAGGAMPTSKDDLLVIWNRYGVQEEQANRWEGAGGTVLVCENGYIGTDAKGRQLYAIAVHGHNGSGWFPVGVEDRFSPLGIDVKPWRTSGDHVLLAAQRGIGSKEMASPSGWHVKAAHYLSKRTKRTIRVRAHPGTVAPPRTLDDDLAGAWSCAIWSSSSGIKALTLGIPVLWDAPHWIAQQAAAPLGCVENPRTSDDDRAAALQRMAHAQWRVDEIEAGEPFARIKAGLWAAKW